MSTSHRWWVLTLLLVLVFPLGAAFADEADEEGDLDAPALEVASKEVAKELADKLKAASKKKKPTDIEPVLDEVEGLTHDSFIKPLLKMMTHANGTVATRAAELLEERRFCVDDPEEIDEKLLKSMWKNAFKHKSNDKRYIVRAIVYRTYGQAGFTLDKGKYKELERDWRWMIGNPNEKFADALIVICDYFEVTKDKRHSRKLAEELDEPIAENPNSPTNPPAEWWERRWKMWNPTKPAVVAALLAITGQEFDKTEEAKAWFQANEKTFGFKW